MACLSFSVSRRPGRYCGAAARQSRAAAFLAGLAFAALTFAFVAGCGQSGITYTSDQFRFSLTYDASLAPAAHATAGVLTEGKPAGVIAFLDPAAPRAGGRYVDGVWVAVIRLPAGAHWPAPSAVGAELRRGITAAVAGGLHGSVTQTTTRQVNGTPAWAVGYDYRLGGTAVRAVTYVLVKGDYEYQVTLQAAAARWADMLPRLVHSVDSFTLR